MKFRVSVTWGGGVPAVGFLPGRRVRGLLRSLRLWEMWRGLPGVGDGVRFWDGVYLGARVQVGVENVGFWLGEIRRWDGVSAAQADLVRDLTQGGTASSGS